LHAVDDCILRIVMVLILLNIIVILEVAIVLLMRWNLELLVSIRCYTFTSALVNLDWDFESLRGITFKVKRLIRSLLLVTVSHL
jgi:hypothetical protein